MPLITSPSSSLLKDMWERLDYAHPNVLNKSAFIETYSRAPVICVLSAGVLRVESFTPGGTAHIHCLIWAPVRARDIREIREALYRIKEMLGVLSIGAVIMDTTRGLKSLFHRIGFAQTLESPFGFNPPWLNPGSVWLYAPWRY